MKGCLTIFSSLLMSAALLAVMKMRRKELEKDEKQRTFLDIKLRVTLDVWSEYQRQVEEINKKIEFSEAEEKMLLHNASSIDVKTGSLRTLILDCTSQEQKSADELATATTELNYHIREYKTEAEAWEKENVDLKQQLAQQSLVCDFLKPNSEAVRNYCGDKVVGPPPQEKPKPVPQKEEPKQGAHK